MVEGFTLNCPIRGRLKVTGKSKDGLTPNEETYRVEALRHLIAQGYPKENFLVEVTVISKIGNDGRNSMRADFAVLDVPAEHGKGDEWLRDHALVLGEVKRDSKDAEKAIEYQAKPLLGFAATDSCVAIYWDNVNQIVFWRERVKGKTTILQGPIESLPPFGQKPGAKALELAQLREDPPLREIFKRVEDTLQAGAVSPSKRFQVMMLLLLAKIHDELAADQGGQPLKIQDYRSLGYSFEAAQKTFLDAATSAVDYYKKHLPEPVSTDMKLNESTFFDVLALLAPHKITSASQSVIQDFYMYFARGLYKWDLAQYFTPPSITAFIVETVSPAWNEDVLDPACGSADFLTAAYRRGESARYKKYADKMWGNDLSPEAVQVAVMNMVLNGDGKSNINHIDSLTLGDEQEGDWDVLICNPPFGRKIKVTDPKILKKYDLGCVGFDRDAKDATNLKDQETGLLFLELCLRLAKAGTGRVAIIVPNGYLGNTSERYLGARRWVLKQARFAGVIALPRFTFKSSGADVSASILLLEKRKKPLETLPNSEEYSTTVQVIDNVGWMTGDKKMAVTYVRDQEDGTLELDDELNPIVLSDFAACLSDLRNSDAANNFQWLGRPADGKGPPSDGSGYSINVSDILADPYLTMDAKRLSRKYRQTREAILATSHFKVGDVVEVLDERTSSIGEKVNKESKKLYGYIELQHVEAGTFRLMMTRGWELPDRAKHFAEPGDIYVGSVWGSVRKWFMVGDRDRNLVVTNGMFRLRVKPGQEALRLDLIAGLCTEVYSVQMRAVARGSDGLAEVRTEDLLNVVLPKITNTVARKELTVFIDRLTHGVTDIEAAVRALSQDGAMPLAPLPERTSHVHMV